MLRMRRGMEYDTYFTFVVQGRDRSAYALPVRRSLLRSDYAALESTTAADIPSASGEKKGLGSLKRSCCFIYGQTHNV